jgi:RNase H-fold protein (predicted Holliday junction resolvase)
MTVYLGFDPGRDKCGVAVMDDARQILCHQVILSSDVIEIVNSLRQEYDISLLVMGNQTTSQAWQQRLQLELTPPLAIALINERNSTMEARVRYWEMYPPSFPQKLIPQGMRLPPRAIDDIVAILLIERYLASIDE